MRTAKWMTAKASPHGPTMIHTYVCQHAVKALTRRNELLLNWTMQMLRFFHQTKAMQLNLDGWESWWDQRTMSVWKGMQHAAAYTVTPRLCVRKVPYPSGAVAAHLALAYWSQQAEFYTEMFSNICQSCETALRSHSVIVDGVLHLNVVPR